MSAVSPYLCCQPKAILILTNSRGDGDKMFAVRVDQIVDVFENVNESWQNIEDRGRNEVGMTTTSGSCFYTRAMRFDDILRAIGWLCPETPESPESPKIP